MAAKMFNKTIIALSMALTLGISGCTGCSPHEFSSGESSMSSISSENTYEIRWTNYGNKLIYSETVAEGVTPVYQGETPTRQSSEKYNYVFSGWSPEIVPAYKDATYKAQYTSEFKKFSVAFVTGNCTCRYSQDLITDVPYGTRVATDGNAIIINGTRVTVEATPTEGESILHNYSFQSWSVNDGYEITGNTTISAFFNAVDKLYSFTVRAVGGGLVRDDSSTNTEYFYPNGKSYTISAFGGDVGQPALLPDILFETFINGVPKDYTFGCWFPYEDFHTYAFDGWFYNDEPLLYGVDLTGDVVIEARFHQIDIDQSDLFEYEINTLTQDATIIAPTFAYYEVDNLVIPRTYQGYRVVGIKAGVLTNIRIAEGLYIPNTLMYIEEGTEETTLCSASTGVLNKIVVEEGSSGFRMVNGVLYDYDLTTVMAGTLEMTDYLVDGHLTIPETVTYMWRSAFAHIQIKTVDLPSGITAIPYKAFHCCDLESVIIPEGVTVIEMNAFRAAAFESIVIPDSVEFINGWAFGNCDNLKYVHLGAGLDGFNYDSFYSCYNIESFTVSEDSPYMTAYNGLLYNKARTYLYRVPSGLKDDPKNLFAAEMIGIYAYAFEFCQIETLHLPEGLVSLLNMAIYGAQNLTSVYLPSTLRGIQCACFDECYNLSYMEYNGTMEQWNQISKETAPREWDKGLMVTEIVCSDGVVPHVVH